jgi:hypothetical protein
MFNEQDPSALTTTADFCKAALDAYQPMAPNPKKRRIGTAALDV